MVKRKSKESYRGILSQQDASDSESDDGDACEICQRATDPLNMLLCDSCDLGFHLYCLKPAMKKIPDDEWFCAKCSRHKHQLPQFVEDNIKSVFDRVNWPSANGSHAKKRQKTNRTSVPTATLTYTLRCHSAGGNPKDNKSIVWNCAFMPGGDHDHSGEGAIVASVGSNIVSVVDCASGEVVKMYRDLQGDMFYDVQWLVVSGELLLAAAGVGSVVHLISYNQNICYEMLKGHRKAINSLATCPWNQSWLLSGSDDGCVMLWDVKTPQLGESSVCLAKFPLPGSPSIIAIAVNPYAQEFSVGTCDSHIFRFRMAPSHFKEATKRSVAHTTCSTITATYEEIHMSQVDAIVYFDKNIIVSKGACDEDITVWDGQTVGSMTLKQFQKQHPNLSASKSKEAYVNLGIKGTFIYPSDKNYYSLKMTLSSDRQFIYAGTPQGNVNVYSVSRMVQALSYEKDVEPDAVASHPTSKAAIRCVAIDNENRYMVAVNNANLMYIWRLE